MNRIFDRLASGCLLVVGHNPGMEDLVSDLSLMRQAMPTAAVARFSFSGNSWSELGARRAVLALVEPDRVVVAVEGRSADGLARAVVSDPPPGTHVEAAGEQDGLPRLRVESAGVPPPSAD